MNIEQKKIKECPKCGKQIFTRRKYCSSHCQYFYNLIKKENEAHLPPLKKRNNKYFSMITGYGIAKIKGSMRNGRRSGGMVVGSMSARVNCTIEKWVELTSENLKTHFSSIPFYEPKGIMLGNGQFIKKEDIFKITGIDFY